MDNEYYHIIKITIVKYIIIEMYRLLFTYFEAFTPVPLPFYQVR